MLTFMWRQPSVKSKSVAVASRFRRAVAQVAEGGPDRVMIVHRGPVDRQALRDWGMRYNLQVSGRPAFS